LIHWDKFHETMLVDSWSVVDGQTVPYRDARQLISLSFSPLLSLSLSLLFNLLACYTLWVSFKTSSALWGKFSPRSDSFNHKRLPSRKQASPLVSTSQSAFFNNIVAKRPRCLSLLSINLASSTLNYRENASTWSRCALRLIFDEINDISARWKSFYYDLLYRYNSVKMSRYTNVLVFIISY